MITYEKTINHLTRFSNAVKAVSYKINGIAYEVGCVKIQIIANLTAQEQSDLDDVVNNFVDVYDPKDVTVTMIEYQRELGAEVIAALKLRNRIEGITKDQSSHYLTRTEAHLLMLREGLIESSRDHTAATTPDDMTEDFHFLTQARIDAVVTDIDAALVKVTTKLGELTL